jgi:hypothetical protein
MKRLIYQVYIGKKSKLYDFCTNSVKEYCEKYDIDYICQKTPILRIKPNPFLTNRHPRAWEQHGGFLPIFEKENAFDYFDRYDQICIIDADIFIRPESPYVFDQINADQDFAACCEREMPLNNLFKGKVVEYSDAQFSDLKDVDWRWENGSAEYYNMGLMLMNNSFSKHFNGQTARQFLGRSEFQRFVDGVGKWKWSTDQVLLNWWIKKCKMNVNNLEWKFNCMFSAIEPEVLSEAHFIHFFKRDRLPNKGEDVVSLKKMIRV